METCGRSARWGNERRTMPGKHGEMRGRSGKMGKQVEWGKGEEGWSVVVEGGDA